MTNARKLHRSWTYVHQEDDGQMTAHVKGNTAKVMRGRINFSYYSLRKKKKTLEILRMNSQRTSNRIHIKTQQFVGKLIKNTFLLSQGSCLKYNTMKK